MKQTKFWPARLGVGLILATIIAPSTAGATTFFPQKFKCPVGGKSFETAVVGSNTTFGQRPDGKPYSPLPVVPLPECPDNGFIIYKEKFSTDEIRRVTPLLATPEWQAMRKSESLYFRLWHLQSALNAPAAERAFVLLVASWEMDRNPVKKALYQAAFVEAVRNLGSDTPADDRFILAMRAANALRELGRFDEAATSLASLTGKAGDLSDLDERTQSLKLIEALQALVTARVSASEPVTLAPEGMAIFPCVTRIATMVSLERQVCESPAVRQAIAETVTTTAHDKQLKGEEAVRYLVHEAEITAQ